jgi:hypothetical protein
MAEPATTKLTAMAALAAFIGPMAAEYSLILAGALVGGIISLSLRKDPWPGRWMPFGHALTGVLTALVVTPLGALVADRLAPSGWELPSDLLLPVIALGIAAYWHRAATEWLPDRLKRGKP